MACQAIDINLACVNGCCTRRNNFPPVTTTTTTRAPQPNPLCDGREASAGYCRAGGLCASGFLCRGNNVCCRCAYGISIGPCVNGRCPDDYQCNINNECCPYQVGK
nr:Hypothetical protein CBG08832 [Haemonchus contortus]